MSRILDWLWGALIFGVSCLIALGVTTTFGEGKLTSAYYQVEKR